MEITMQFCFTIIVGSFIAVAAMASSDLEPRRKRQPPQYIYIVNGVEYQTKLEALKAALGSGKASVHQCRDRGLAELVKK